MRLFNRVSALWLVWLGCVLGLGINGVFAAETTGNTDTAWVSKVVSLQGGVLAKRMHESDWRPVSLNDTFFVGDQIRVGANSRAGIVLSNDAVLRLDQQTTMVFTEIEKPATFVLELLRGAANFFSHRPRSLKIITPFVNGVVEGTEFFVRVDAGQTRMDLFHGRILAENDYGRLHLEKGQGIRVPAGSAPQRQILVQPRDSVQWALYYPPVPDPALTRRSKAVAASKALFDRGRTREALERLEPVDAAERDAGFHVYRAGLLLHVGRVAEAGADIRRARQLDPQNGDAVALQSIIAVVQNCTAEALELAWQAVALAPDSPAARIALSHARQADFDLPGAQQAADAAVAHAPQSGLSRARLAELRLSMGDLETGVAAAQKAVEIDPDTAHAHTVLGFAHLMRIRTEAARRAFERAIALDSAAPLPRLGLGLADIRDGDLEKGRSEIEIAAGLDPGSALIRSYLGKAYFDEKRGPMDGQQFEIAKSLDPFDPTAWFYDAIRKQTENRPVEALRDLQTSIERNDNRAVYRSSLMLDQDLAARSASLGRIYDDLGFEQMALNQGAKSVNSDPGDFSGHRFLADSYANLRRHEIARASELLQSQLLQPLNVTPLQPQLGSTDLLVLEGAGPASPAFNEFNPLFVSDGVNLQTSGIVGSNDTLGDEVMLSGLYRNLSLSLGQFHYETDGWRENNDLTQDVYNVFAQAALSPQVSVQAEYRVEDTERGDVAIFFDPDFFSPNRRWDQRRESLRIGGKVQLSQNDTLIASLIHSDWRRDITDGSEASDSVVQVFTELEVVDDAEAYSGEIQYLRQASRFNLIVGGGHLEQNETVDNDITVTMVQQSLSLSLPPIVKTTKQDQDARHTNGYVYTHIKPRENLTLTLGFSYDDYASETVDENKFHPKAGVTWSPNRIVTLRAAWFQAIKRPFAIGQTIEPTQVAGFNQVFDDVSGSETERYGVGLDARFSDRIFGGVEFSWRDLDFQALSTTATDATTMLDQQEALHRLYLYWTPTDRLALGLEGFYEKLENPDLDPEELTTWRLPLSLSYFFPYGFSVKTTASYVDQEVTPFADRSQGDDFWVVDLFLGCRLPRRWGTATLGIKNLFDRSFNFQDVNFASQEPTAPLYQPERLIFGQVTVSF
ncbi:hypothetical protein DSCO28_66240 [Desulfosarcina ovata subsp. sediminis]|uniref:Uncharacterized protein n=1 Tax=Desulfosarcina ovata subsp. sediminis TaxID=885957 RepID=A0A5K8A119_9BACT|nr:TonB-dependent receptor [Desulfosarcina ovata]BBO86058.1 hypothetical protein DSCO28_66240 [Desulfosarcina ovata subsp. sediminis]